MTGNQCLAFASFPLAFQVTLLLNVASAHLTLRASSRLVFSLSQHLHLTRTLCSCIAR